MLDNIMLYWRSNTGASSARLYFESFATDFSRQRLDIPVGVSVFPGELYRPLKIGADRTYSKLLYSNEVARGRTLPRSSNPTFSSPNCARASLNCIDRTRCELT
jgi:hypothetical protein